MGNFVLVSAGGVKTIDATFQSEMQDHKYLQKEIVEICLHL